MKRFIVFVVLVVALLAPVSSAHAHVLVTDTTRTKGAMLHIVPDDDPIAGQRAVVYFDIQSQGVEVAAQASMQVVHPDNSEATLSMKTEGNLATAAYTFPVQGVYRLIFTTTIGGEEYVFEVSQRISRGIIGTALDTQQYIWAEMLVIGSSVGLLILGIAVFNRRKAIAEQSIF